MLVRFIGDIDLENFFLIEGKYGLVFVCQLYKFMKIF